MGTHNRERRRAKQAARTKAQQRGRADWSESGRATPSTQRQSPWRGTGSGARFASDREAVAALIHQAAHASCDGRNDGSDLIGRLVRGEFGGHGRSLVAAELERSVTDLVVLLLLNGWEPVDLWEIARRRTSTASASFVGAVLPLAVARTSQSEGLVDWEAQCRAIEGRRSLDPSSPNWASDVAAAIGVIDLLDHLPRLDRLASPAEGLRANGPTPRGSEDGSAGILSKIRALLAKAESTDFAEEADAYTAKATELMLRYRIDRAAVEASTGVSQASGVGLRRCWIDAPYVEAKSVLFRVVADASNCRAVRSDLGFVTVVGQLDDLDMTELLYTSLLVQATHQMTIAGTTTPAETAEARARVASTLNLLDDAEPGSPTSKTLGAEFIQTMFASAITKRKRNPSFRKAFLVAYATRIEKRLAEAARATNVAAAEALGGAFLPVLARHQRSVDDAVDRVFGTLRTTTIRVTDQAGWAAGTAAADLADLNVRGQLRTG